MAVVVPASEGQGKQVYSAWKKYPTEAELLEYIKDPSAKVPGIKMPTWQGVIADEELAPLASYVQTLQVKTGS